MHDARAYSLSRPRHPVDERVVTIGGGTGSFTMLSHLKRVVARLSAIVTMMDSGGSSRRLMDEFGRPLPVGDLRQALVALSGSSRLWGDVFNHRFTTAPGSALDGHSLGNLILHALQDQNAGDLPAALADAEELLDAAGRVIPVTLDRAMLCAELTDGTLIRGESAIDRPEGRRVLPIARVFLDPAPTALHTAVKELRRADRIVIGPGDLYTSVVPCLLVDGIVDALHACEGEVVYICNLMTKHGETDGYAAPDFVRAIQRHLGRRLDAVVVNIAPIDPLLAERYAAEASHPVAPDLGRLAALGPRPIAGAFVTDGPLIRHDSVAVARAIWPDHLAGDRAVGDAGADGARPEPASAAGAGAASAAW
jgi:uncharacterized cofD-like protein